MSAKNQFKKIILTFDLEYWFESPSIQTYIDKSANDSLAGFLEKVVTVLRAGNAKATFFVSGKVIELEPTLIKKISDEGHEIALHSLDHQPLWLKNKEQFQQDIKQLAEKISQVTGKKPTGHRAANFSLNKNTAWALKILAENDIKYDSSIFPYEFPKWLAKIYSNALYGTKGNLFEPYKIDLNDPNKENQESPLIELPVSIFHSGFLKIPLTGGIYIRLIPWWLFKLLLKIQQKNQVSCIHFHPYDFLDQPPDIRMPKIKKMVKYFNTRNTWKKLSYLTTEFNCISAADYLNL